MKKTIAALLCMMLLLPALPVCAEPELAQSAKAYILVEQRSGTVIAENNADEALPCANVAMNMGILVTLKAIQSGKLREGDKVTVSNKAWKMGGTTVFLDNTESYNAGDLLKAVIVCSANDAMIALAEHISGSEEAFVAELNAEAGRMGLSGTAFSSATGQDDAGQHTTARDAATVMAELCDHKLYLEWSGIWLDEFAHPSGRTTEMVNYNKLVRFYSGADGGKTGSSGTAGYCIAATAKRDADRYVYAALGDSSAQRFDNARSAFDYAFNNFTSKTPVRAGRIVVRDIPVTDGDASAVDGIASETISVLLKASEAGELEKEATVEETLEAPVEEGAKIGELTVTLNGETVGKCDIVAGSEVKRLDFPAAIKRVISLWAD